MSNPTNPTLRDRASRLGLIGLLANWEEVSQQPWLSTLLEYEERERGRRSLERRLKNAKLGQFKLMADFDWAWPTEIDRELVNELFELQFISEAANVVLVGSNGVGKTMIAKNLAYQAILRGYTALYHRERASQRPRGAAVRLGTHPTAAPL